MVPVPGSVGRADGWRTRLYLLAAGRDRNRGRIRPVSRRGAAVL